MEQFLKEKYNLLIWFAFLLLADQSSFLYYAPKEIVSFVKWLIEVEFWARCLTESTTLNNP